MQMQMNMRGLVAMAFSVICGEALNAQAAAGRRSAGATLLHGTVHDTLGAAVTGALVRVLPGSTSVISDGDGRFVVRAARGSRVTLAVSRDGFPALKMEVDVSAADADTVDVFLFGAVAQAAEPRVTAQPASAPVERPALGPTPVEERRQPYTLSGTVTDTMGMPLAGATVTVVSQQRSVLTDGAGRYRLAGLAAGAVLVRVRRLGFAPRNFATSVSATDAVIADIPLEGLGQLLRRVDVRSDAVANNTKLRGFFERKRAGFGQYLTRDQFADRNPTRFTELVNRMSGVVAAEDANGRRRIYGRGRCEMAIFLDGVNMTIPPNTSVDDFFNVNEIDALEVHTGVSQLPPEFSGRTNACGVVAAWTRSKAGR